MASKAKIGVLGASGYTGADLVRLAARHPHIEIVALTAGSNNSGKPMAEVREQLAAGASDSQDVRLMLEFIERSERGLLR